MREVDPLLLRQLFHQVALDLHRVGLCRQAQPLGEPRHVRIDHHAGGDAEGRAQHDVGRLAAHARQVHEFLQRRGHLAAVLVDQLLAAGLDALGLVAKEAGALDGLFQLRQRRGGISRRPCGYR